jgi:hypothetical protein
MDKKITRRAVLGAVFAALVAGPLVMRASRKNGVIDLQSEIAESLSFPRKFDTELGLGANLDAWPAPPPKEVSERIHAVQKRFWQNYSRLDELKYVLSSSSRRDGQLVPSSHDFYHAEVWIKLGFGVEIKGRNTLGKRVHLVLNDYGEDNQPFDEHRVNLRSYIHSVFGKAFPMYAKSYIAIEESVQPLPNTFRRAQAYATDPRYPPGLPESFFETQPNGLYTQMTGPADNLLPPWNVFRDRYFSQETGMPELTLVESVLEGFEMGSPLYESCTYQNVSDIYFPLQYNFGKIDKWGSGKAVYAKKREYSDVQLKFIS